MWSHAYWKHDLQIFQSNDSKVIFLGISNLTYESKIQYNCFSFYKFGRSLALLTYLSFLSTLLYSRICKSEKNKDRIIKFFCFETLPACTQ